MNQIKRLYRSRFNRVLGGVCYGVSEYFNLDPSLVRLAWLFFTLLGGAGLVAYFLAWIIIPESPYGT